jgi:UDP-GlcNAc3NAcA epimerase
MRKLRFISIVGARPQFVKAAVLSRALSQYTNVKEIIVHTGQHYDAEMSEVFFDELGIPRPEFNLQISGGSHADMTARMMISIENVFNKIQPDAIIVFGDTNSTLAASLVASKMLIPVAHVEAGLRSFNNRMPEEINRIITDRLSSYLFTPTKEATKNLINEGYANEHVFEVGDVMFDATKLFYDPNLNNKFGKNYILTTLHRAENTDDPKILEKYLRNLSTLSQQVPIIFPIHPRTKKIMDQHKFKLDVNDSLKIINPVGYKEMLSLIANSLMVITDSGGLQKEAYFLGKKCFTYRNETEWVELLENGWNKLIKTSSDPITLHQMNNFLAEDPCLTDLYGGGNSASKIASILIESLSNKD